jgi:hypothetical protein
MIPLKLAAPSEGRIPKMPWAAAGARILPRAGTWVNLTVKNKQPIDEIGRKRTIGADGYIKPVISCNRGSAAGAAPACREIAVTAGIERTMVINPVTDWPLAVGKLGCLGLADDDEAEIYESLDGLGARCARGLKFSVGKRRRPSFEALEVNDVLDR